MMSDLLAFTRTIKANPGDTTARLVFADWLEERGEADAAAMFRLSVDRIQLLEKAAEIEKRIAELGVKLKDDKRAEVIVLRQIFAVRKLAPESPPSPSHSSPE